MTSRGVHPSRAVLRELLEASTPERVYQTVLDAAHDRLGADSCAVAVDVDGSLEVSKTVGHPLPDAVDGRFGPAVHLLDDVDQTGQSCLVDDCHRIDSATTDTASRTVTHADFRSVVCASIGECGVVFAVAAAPGSFSGTDEEWLDELGAYAGSALRGFASPCPGVDRLDGAIPRPGDAENGDTATAHEPDRGQQQLEKHAADLRRLHTSANRLYTADTVDQCYGITTEAALEILGFDWCAVLVPDDGAFAVEAASEAGDRPLDTDDGVAGQVYRTGESVVRGGSGANGDGEPTNSRIHSTVTVPVGGWGVLQAVSTEQIYRDGGAVDKVELLATSMATAVERIERQKRLEAQKSELEARMAQLERQNERLDQLVSIVSHDLRNPLSVASGHIELAAAEVDNEHLDAVGNALERMDELIEQLLLLAREGEQLGEVGAVSLGSVAEACWSTVETAEASVSVETDRIIRANRERLKQLLENLLRNAVEHGDGTETITVGAMDGGFYVADDGTGIPADQREAVFEWGHSTDQSGTGYGLTIVRRIAEAHGWEVAATESATGGARFEITGVEVVSG